MASKIKRAVILSAAAGILSMIALYLYIWPGLRRLPKARQRSLDGVLTIEDAVRHLRSSGNTGWELVAAAQALVNAKMEYSRRNGWDTPPCAFRRGMGYCQQQAMALLLILCRLGIAARPVQALRCKFPPKRIHEYDDPGGIPGHMWLVVSIDGVEKDVCPGHPDNWPGKVHFDVLSRRTEYPPVMRLFGHIGSMILNVHRDNAALRTIERSIAMKTADTKSPSTKLLERIATRIEHEVDTRSVRLAASLIRLTKGRVAQLWRRQVLLLTTRGRKSGRERTVPLQFFPDGDDMIIVAANSGLSSSPGWYFNLTANPFARVEVGDRTLEVHAKELSDEEAAAFWPRVLQVAPDYARYPSRTSRRIPLIRLVLATPTESPTSSRPSAEVSRNASLQPTEIAPGVYCLPTGRGITESDVYFVRSGASWVLIDTGWANCGQLIKQSAEALFGAQAHPAAILLTHIHLDHSGSALELACLWAARSTCIPMNCPSRPRISRPSSGMPTRSIAGSSSRCCACCRAAAPSRGPASRASKT